MEKRIESIGIRIKCKDKQGNIQTHGFLFRFIGEEYLYISFHAFKYLINILRFVCGVEMEVEEYE